MEALEAVYKAMFDLYNENLDLIKHVDRQLYERVISLSNDIDKKKYIPRYELELINSSFDIYDLQKKEFLYNLPLSDYSKNSLDEVKDLTINKAIFILLSDRVFNIKSPKVKRLEDGVTIKNTNLLYETVFKYRKKLNYFKLNQKQKLDYYPSFIFFGTLLAQHITYITNYIKPKHILIVEEDLEIFRLSLFVTEYKQLVQYAKSITFCIETEELDILNKYYSFLSNSILHNYIIKFFSTSRHSIKLIELFSISIYKKTPVGYDFIRMLEYFNITINRLKKHSHITPAKKEHPLSNKPVLILGPGPSLRKNIKFVKKNKNKFILVAFSATVNLLCEYGIKPDIITLVDGSDLLLTHFKDKCKGIYKNSIKIFATNTHDIVFNQTGLTDLYLMETVFRLSEDGLYESPAMTVGDGSLFLFLALKFKNIYLLGTDLAIDEKSGSGYDKTHSGSKKQISTIKLNNNIKEITLIPKINKNFVKIRGNFKNSVYSNEFFVSIINSYSNIINFFKNQSFDFNIYNLNDGAYIPQTLPIKIDDIQLKPIKNKKKILKETIKQLSSENLIKEDKVKKEIKFLDKLLTQVKIFENSEIEIYKDFEIFNYNIIQSINKHISFSQITKAVIFNFIELLSNYILYYFNSPNNNKKLLNDVKVLWCDDLKKVLTNLINGFKNV